MSRLALVITVFFLLVTTCVAASQTPVSNHLRTQSIEQIIEAVNDFYYDAKSAEIITKRLHNRYLKSLNAKPISLMQFVRQVNDELFDASGNGYFLFDISTSPSIQHAKASFFGQMEDEKAIETKFISSDIAYIQANYLGQGETITNQIDSAFVQADSAKALILDIRQLETVDINQAQHLLSYIFSPNTSIIAFKSIHKENVLLKSNHVTSKPINDTLPIYLLTSSILERGAELIAFSLQNTNRAYVIGEPTMGVAQWQENIVISDSFSLKVPYFYAIEAESGISWEGGGVEPDLEIKSGEALASAVNIATQFLLNQNKD